MIDLDLLIKLFGNRETVNKFLLVFQKDVPVLMDKLKEDHSAKLAEEVAINAHSLKSQFTYLKAERAKDLSIQIELQCSSSTEYPFPTIERLIKNLEAEIELILIEIERLV